MSDLKSGVVDHLDRGKRSIAELYDQRLEIVEQYEGCGFCADHLAEHHSTPLGMAPSPSVFVVASQSGAIVDGKIVARPMFGDAPVISDLVRGKITDPLAQKTFAYGEQVIQVGT